MSLIRLNRKVSSCVVARVRNFSTPAASEEEEYTATPQYPPILDLSYEKKWERKREDKCEKVKNVKTVEEKQLKLNIPRYYGFRTYMLHEGLIPYNSLPFSQYVTRTHLIESNGLPEYYTNIGVTDNFDNIVKDVEEAILMETEGIKQYKELRNDDLSPAEREDLLAKRIVTSISRVINNTLVHEHSHLKDNELDSEPRLEASWLVGGMPPNEPVKRARKRHPFYKEMVDEPVDRCIGYIGHPILSIRAGLPLPCVVPISECENPDLTVPLFAYDPKVLGTSVDYRHATNIPGVWPGDSSTFGLLSYLKTGHLINRADHFDVQDDLKEALHHQAILSSFGWLHAQANHLGFTTFNDITYPLVTQTVLTNGKEFHFYVYQLNTILLHYKHARDNPRRNLCWSSGSLKLFEEVKEGKVVGLNDEVLKILVKLYVNAPQERLGVNLRPYLSQEEKLAADYEDEDKRKWLEREYKFLMANRPRLQEIDEIYMWEKIYKIDHKTRPMEKRSRFFELFKNPAARKLSDRLPEYIPRALRPDLPRYKGRYGKDYWP